MESLHVSTAAPPPESREEVLKRCLEHLRRILPKDWQLDYLKGPLVSGSTLLTIRSGRGEVGYAEVEVKRNVLIREIPRLMESLGTGAASFVYPGAGLIAARYLSPTIRSALENSGINYVDAAGNSRLALTHPHIFIHTERALKDPWRGPGRPRGSLRGEPAARVVRALIDHAYPMTMAELQKLAGTSAGSTYRMRDFLASEGFLRKATDERIQVSDWMSLLRVWASEYQPRHVSKGTFIAPRGIDWLRSKLAKETNLRYAVTGTLAAQEWAPYAPLDMARIYVEDTMAAVTTLDLHPAPKGHNVLLIEPGNQNDWVFSNPAYAKDRVRLASPAQVAVDLLSGPGRNPAEGEALLRWMAINERKWRIWTRP